MTPIMIVRNNVDPPCEQRDAITKIEMLKHKIHNAKIERNEICKQLKKLRQKLNRAEREYEERYGKQEDQTRQD